MRISRQRRQKSGLYHGLCIVLWCEARCCHACLGGSISQTWTTRNCCVCPMAALRHFPWVLFFLLLFYISWSFAFFLSLIPQSLEKWSPAIWTDLVVVLIHICCAYIYTVPFHSSLPQSSVHSPSNVADLYARDTIGSLSDNIIIHRRALRYQLLCHTVHRLCSSLFLRKLMKVQSKPYSSWFTKTKSSKSTTIVKNDLGWLLKKQRPTDLLPSTL